MGCCSSREFVPTKEGDKLLTPKARLSESMVQLSRYHESLQKLNTHLKHYHHMSSDFYTLLYELKSVKRDYLRKSQALEESVSRMNELLTTLDSEVQAQYMSDKESTELSKEELFSVIQIHKVQQQAERLEHLSDTLRSCIECGDRKEEFKQRLDASGEAVRKAAGAIVGHIRVIQDSKKGIKNLTSSLPDVKEVPEMNDRWREAVQRWDQLCKASLKLSEETESFAQWLLFHFQGIEGELATVRKEIEGYFEEETVKGKAKEVQSAAEMYLRLIEGEREGNASADCIMHAPVTPQLSYADCQGLLALLPPAADASLYSPEEMYARLLECIHAKADNDVQRLSRKSRPMPFDLFLMSTTESSCDSRLSVEQHLSKFVRSVESLRATRVGKLAEEMLKLRQGEERMNLHEEMFVCKASREMQDIIDRESCDTNISEQWETGGCFALHSVLPILERWFTSEPEIGESIIAGLLPALHPKELVEYYVGYKLLLSGKSAEEMFEELDLKGEGRLEKDGFVEGVRCKLSIMLPASYLEDLCVSSLNRESFLSLFPAARYLAMANSAQYRISRITVISALREGYQEWKREIQSMSYLEFLLIPSQEEKISEEGTAVLVQNLAPELPPKHVRSYARHLNNPSSTALSFESFLSFFLQYPVGPSAKSFFCKG